MQTSDQGTRDPIHQRYQAISRTLIFLTSANPVTGEQEVLLLHGAPHKRLWANLYNGLGGHVEAGEDVYTAACREVAEETGIAIDKLSLRGVVNIDAGADELGQRPGVLVLIFVGSSKARAVKPSKEGSLAWVAVSRLGELPLVEDLYEVIPRALSGRRFFGHYTAQEDGEMRFLFRDD